LINFVRIAVCFGPAGGHCGPSLEWLCTRPLRADSAIDGDDCGGWRAQVIAVRGAQLSEWSKIVDHELICTN